MRKARSWVQLIVEVFSRLIRRVRTSEIGIIQSYDPDTRLCSVLPAAKIPPGVETVGAGIEVPTDESDPDTLQGVPVLWPSVRTANTSFILHCPLPRGTAGMIVYGWREIGLWTENGGQYTPDAEELHGLNGAVFIPGLSPKFERFSGANNSDVVLEATTNGVTNSVILGADGISIVGDRTATGARDAAQQAVLGTKMMASLVNPLLTALSSVSVVALLPDLATAAKTIQGVISGDPIVSTKNFLDK